MTVVIPVSRQANLLPQRALRHEQLTMLAAPLADEALWDEADVLGSITPEEQALIDEANSAP